MASGRLKPLDSSPEQEISMKRRAGKGLSPALRKWVLTGQ
jgi:hypothetical protein